MKKVHQKFHIFLIFEESSPAEQMQAISVIEIWSR